MKRKRSYRVVLLFYTDPDIDRHRVHGILRYTQLHPSWSVTLVPDHPANRTGLAEKIEGVDGMITNEYSLLHFGEGPRQWRSVRNLVIFDGNSDKRFIPGARQVNFDYDSAARGTLAADYFVRHGFKNLAYVNMMAHRLWSDTRAAAFAKEAERRGARCIIYTPENANHVSDAKALSKWLLALPKPCGVLGANDARALQVAELCRRHGIEVPGQLAILGVDNNDLACDFCKPPLSSIEEDDEAAGFEAAGILDELMRGRPSPAAVVFNGNPHIVERDSTLDPKGTARIVSRARQFLKENFRSGIDVKDASKAAGVSRRTLERRFADSGARPPAEELRELRLAEMKRLLSETTMPVREITERCGFRAATGASIAFRRKFGLPPAEFRQAGALRLQRQSRHLGE